MSPFIERLGWVLIHSLWQLALLAAAAFVVQRAMRRTSAAARYAALLALLGLVVAAPLITWSVLPTPAVLPVAELPAPAPALAPVPAPKPEPPAPVLTPAPVTGRETAPITPVAPAPLETVVPAAAPAPLQPTWSQWAQQSITPWLSTIVWGWSLGVLAFAIRPLWSWFTVRQLRTQGVSPVSESVQAALAETARRLGVTQAVRVLQSTIVQVPIVAGYLKPVILLPASIVTGLPASQLEAILAHELAHIRRHDYLANLIQTLVETVFFYHPAVWWLSHQIRSERENCCDDIAVAMLGNRVDYSRALLAVEELRGTPTTLAVGASGGSLLGRVRRLFHRDTNHATVAHGSLIVCTILALGIATLGTIAGSIDQADEKSIPGAKIEIDGYGTLELVGCRDVADRWWKPDGTDVASDFDPGLKEMFSFNDDPRNGRQIGMLAHFQGLVPPKQLTVELLTEREGNHGQWVSQDASALPTTRIRLQATNLSSIARTAEIRLRVSFDMWSAWQTIDLVQPSQSQNTGPLTYIIDHDHFQYPPPLQSAIGLVAKNGQKPDFHFEQKAIDASGAEISSGGVFGSNRTIYQMYGVPLSQITKLKYRTIEYTHEVIIRNISLQAEYTTEPIISVKVLKVPARAEDSNFPGPVADDTNWPQLGGSAAHNPISPVTNLPTSFDLAKTENIRWSQPTGDFAFSSPVVSGGKVLIGTNNAIGRDPRFPASVDRACLQCFDERTGEFLWQYSSPKMEQGRRHDWPSIGICSTPVIEGDRVWFATNRCEIVCLDLNGHRDNEDDGEPEASAPGGPSGNARSQRANVVWKYDMFNTLGVRPLNATCVTPVIAGDLLLLNSGNDVDESYMNVPAPEAPAFLAFHKTTGQLIWSDKTPNPNILGNGCSMGAPAVAKIDGVWQAIFAGYDGWLYAFDLECIQRGETLLLWRFDLNPKESQFRLSGPRNEFTYRGLPTTPVVVGNHVFAAVGHNPERGEGLGRLWCIDATKRGDLSSDLVYNKAAPDVVIPHKRVQACEPDKGDFTRPNPNSGVEWVYTTDDLNKNGKIEFEEQMHLSNSLLAIHDGLLLTTDLSGLVHCLDVTTGELLWTHDQLATCWSGPLLADGKVWVIDEDGDLSIFALSREKQLIAEIAMNSPGYTNFAAANQTLYLATKTQLVAIGSVPEEEPLVAKLPGGLEVELVGVTKNGDPAFTGWAPDGSPIQTKEDWKRTTIISRTGENSTRIGNDGVPDPAARDLLFEMRGLRSQPTLSLRKLNAANGWSHLPVTELYRNRWSILLNEPADQATFQVAFTDAAWGPQQRVSPEGEVVEDLELAEPERSLYEKIHVVRAGWNEKESRAELMLERPADWHDHYSMEVVVIDMEGKEYWTLVDSEQKAKGEISTAVYRPWNALLPEQIARWEYRLRPYRHFITFENVSFEPGKKTEPKISVETIAIVVPPKKYIAQVPGGIEVELFGTIRELKSRDRLSLAPDGSPLPSLKPYLEHHSGDALTNMKFGLKEFQDQILYQVRGGDSPTVDVRGPTQFGHHASHKDADGNPIEVLTTRGGSLPKAPMTFTVKVADEPWGEWQQISPTGKLLNELASSSRYSSSYQQVKVISAGQVLDFVIPPEGTPVEINRWADSAVVMEVPADFKEKLAFEFRVVNVEGKTWAGIFEIHDTDKNTISFRLDGRIFREKLVRFEYRLRPYRHVIKFENVSLEPGRKTEPKVSVESIPEATATTSVLELHKPDNTPWQGSLVAGHIGFIPPDAKAWNAWVGKDGQVDLSALPAGKHWLISRFPWSVIPVETPLRQTVRQPLRLGTPPKKHSSSNYSGNLSVQQDEQGREFIQCDLYNNTDELWSFSELDLTLEAGWFSTESHGHSPQWLRDTLTEVPQIEIPPGQKGSLRIDWSEWAKRGVWDPMSGPQAVSKPVLPDQVPGKIWVRIQGPGFGTIPVAVTHPDKLVAVSDEPANPVAAPIFDLQVVDAETGQPIAGAEVTVRQTISSWQPKRPDAATAKLNISIAVPESLSTLRTNATGHFSFTTPPELRDWQSDLQISIRHPGYVIEQSFGAFQITPEMAADPSLLTKKVFPSGLIRLKRGHEISGQILDPDGQPAAGVKLYAAWQMPQYLDMPPHAVTDAQGRYKFRTVKETESDLIFVIPQEAVAVSFPLRSKYGEHPTIQLERGTDITGQVLGQDGKPLAGAVVQANGSDSVYDGFPKPLARVLTDSEGRYRLPPQKLPVDVRVSSLGWMGGWQPPGRSLTIDEVFMPVMVRDESQTGKTPGADASGSQSRTIDFRPSATVTLTARVYDEKGQPATDCELAVYGTAPDSLRDDDKLRSTWRGRFHAVADQPGLFRVKAPKGLVNAMLVDAEIPTGPRQKWTRATSLEESIPGPRTEAGWGVLWNDDESIIVGEPAKTALINTKTDTSGPEPDPARDSGEWGTAIGGLRSRLRLIRDPSQPPASSGKVGQPVFVALEIENASEAEKQLSVSSVFSLDDVQITGPDGKPCPDVRGPLSVLERQITIPPGETKAVIERADLTEQFLMTEPGAYRIRAKSPTVSKELSSGDLPITLAEGEVSPVRGVYRDVQSKAPAGSLLVLVQDQLWVFVSGQTKSTDPQGNPVVKLWHRKDSVPAEELPQGAVELKVPNGSGHWYAEIPEEAKRKWNSAEQDVRQVCEHISRTSGFSKSPPLPWQARGRVVDVEGKPMAGVTVRAATGIGTLLGGGSAITDAEGRYDFRFGLGVRMGKLPDGKPSPQTQYALISAHLDGHFEKNFNRQGKGIGSLEPVSDQDAREFGVEPSQIALPDKPREVDFVMLPAAQVSGTLVGENDQPLKHYSVMLTGGTLPPGSSVLAQVTTDDEGHFEIKDIPTTVPYQFEIRKPGKELMPPWEDSWASGPLTFRPPGEQDVDVISGRDQLTAKSFTLKITGPGVHGKEAVQRAKDRGPNLFRLEQEPNREVLEIGRHEIIWGPLNLKLDRFVWVLRNDSPPQLIEPPDR